MTRCLCPTCTPADLKAAIIRADDLVSTINHAAFELYWNDRTAGRDLQSNEAYYAAATALYIEAKAQALHAQPDSDRRDGVGLVRH